MLWHKRKSWKCKCRQTARLRLSWQTVFTNGKRRIEMEIRIEQKNDVGGRSLSTFWLSRVNWRIHWKRNLRHHSERTPEDRDTWFDKGQQSDGVKFGCKKMRQTQTGHHEPCHEPRNLSEKVWQISKVQTKQWINEKRVRLSSCADSRLSITPSSIVLLSYPPYFLPSGRCVCPQIGRLSVRKRFQIPFQFKEIFVKIGQRSCWMILTVSDTDLS